MISSENNELDTALIPGDGSNRLVFVIEALTVGGAEQMLVAMANYLQKCGWQCHMICLTRAGELAENLHQDVSLHVLDKKPGIDFSVARRLRALVKSIDPLAVNSHLWTANLWARLALVAAGRRIVVTEHSRDTWKPLHYRLIDRLLATLTYRLVAVSADTAKFYSDQIKVSSDKIVVINNGIDTSRYAAVDGTDIRDSLVGNEQLLIGTVGRMISAKNHKRLVNAFARLASDFPNTNLVFVGDGPERESLEECINQSGLGPRIVLLGLRRDVPLILRAFDVFALSSDREGHPMTALEAQTTGTPVVLTDAGGSADAIVKEANCPQNIAYGVVPLSDDDRPLAAGVLVDKSVDALADGLRLLLSSESLRKSMGELGVRRAPEMFDERVMVGRYIKLFRQ